jgi:hypothetical protein
MPFAWSPGEVVVESEPVLPQAASSNAAQSAGSILIVIEVPT